MRHSGLLLVPLFGRDLAVAVAVGGLLPEAEVRASHGKYKYKHKLKLPPHSLFSFFEILNLRDNGRSKYVQGIAFLLLSITFLTII